MMSIYINYSKLGETKNKIYCPIESCVVLALIKYTNTTGRNRVIFVKEKASQTCFQVDVADISYHQDEPLEMPVKCCILPVYYDQEFYCVAGLCSMLRQIILKEDNMNHLLGFRGNCLSACAEQSTWTKFCEVDSMQCVANFYIGKNEWMSDLQELERKLQEPLKIHNKANKKESSAKENTCRYVESQQLLLSDFILAVSVHMIVVNSNPRIFDHVPHVKKWYDLVMSDSRMSKVLSIFTSEQLEPLELNGDSLSRNDNISHSIDNVIPSHQMSKSQKARKFDSRSEDALNFVNTIIPRIKQQGVGYGHNINLDTSDIPYHALPESGDLPEDRVERKCQQLVCMTKAVMKICSPKDIIVDFCSGGGHLGLLIAYLIPECTIILLDNKPQSLWRAQKRARELSLSNLYIIQSNVDYFVGDFDVGTCLHACGVASDLVMQKCVGKNASMVVSPCCYGKIQTCHTVSYPRSSWLKQLNISSSDHHLMSHCADRQSPDWMDWIDADRLEWARENGYSVHLGKLTPLACTPKNNMLVASRVKQLEKS